MSSIEIIEKEIRKYNENLIKSSKRKPIYSNNASDGLIRNMHNNISGRINEENFVCLLDLSLFGNGKQGVVFTTDGIYFREAKKAAQEVPYDELDRIMPVGNKNIMFYLYNSSALFMSDEIDKDNLYCCCVDVLKAMGMDVCQSKVIRSDSGSGRDLNTLFKDLHYEFIEGILSDSIKAHAEEYKMFLSDIKQGYSIEIINDDVMFPVESVADDEMFDLGWDLDFYRRFDLLVEKARNGNPGAQYAVLSDLFDHKLLFFSEKLAKVSKKMVFKETPEIDDTIEYITMGVLARYFSDFRNNSFDLLLHALFLQIENASEDKIIDMHDMFRDKIDELTLILLTLSSKMGCTVAEYFLGLFDLANNKYERGTDRIMDAAQKGCYYAMSLIAEGYEEGKWGLSQSCEVSSLYHLPFVLHYDNSNSLFREEYFNYLMVLSYDVLNERVSAGKAFARGYFNFLYSMLADMIRTSGCEFEVRLKQPQNIRFIDGEKFLFAFHPSSFERYGESDSIVLTDKNLYVSFQGALSVNWKGMPLTACNYDDIFDDFGKLSIPTYLGEELICDQSELESNWSLVVKSIQRFFYDMREGKISNKLKESLSKL